MAAGVMMTRARLLILAALLLLLVVSLLAGDTARSQTPNALDNLPGVYGARVAFGRWLNDADLARLRGVPALRSAWVGYDAGGFDWPADVEGVGAINVSLTPGEWDGLIEWYSAESAPGVLWVLVYATPDALEWTCDGSGNHCGTHPSGGAWVVDAASWARAVTG